MQTEAQKRAQRKYRSTAKFKLSLQRRESRRAKKLQDKRKELLGRFGNRCFICLRSPHYLAFHHLSYDNAYSYKHRGSYKQAMILKEIEAHPESFRLLCSPCHSIVTTILKDESALARLQQVVRVEQGS